jgi:hypothetical protein
VLVTVGWFWTVLERRRADEEQQEPWLEDSKRERGPAVQIGAIDKV